VQVGVANAPAVYGGSVYGGPVYGAPAYVQSAPVYVQPAPVYAAPAPVYYRPRVVAPVVYRPVVRPYGYGYRHHQPRSAPGALLRPRRLWGGRRPPRWAMAPERRAR
jgi:hypothetical protein